MRKLNSLEREVLEHCTGRRPKRIVPEATSAMMCCAWELVELGWLQATPARPGWHHFTATDRGRRALRIDDALLLEGGIFAADESQQP